MPLSPQLQTPKATNIFNSTPQKPPEPIFSRYFAAELAAGRRLDVVAASLRAGGEQILRGLQRDFTRFRVRV